MSTDIDSFRVVVMVRSRCYSPHWYRAFLVAFAPRSGKADAASRGFIPRFFPDLAAFSDTGLLVDKAGGGARSDMTGTTISIVRYCSRAYVLTTGLFYLRVWRYLVIVCLPSCMRF